MTIRASSGRCLDRRDGRDATAAAHTCDGVSRTNWQKWHDALTDDAQRNERQQADRLTVGQEAHQCLT
jgi:hypothetical protein